MLVPKFKDIARVRGTILVQKFRLQDPGDPLQRQLARRIGPDGDHGGLWVPDGEGYGENTFLNVGINRLWELVIGASVATFTNLEAQIGIGDNGAAPAAGQTDLQAAVNKTYKGMDVGYPTAGSGQAAQFKATFGIGDANYAWQEFVVRHASTLICLDRGVASMGTKTSAGTWVPTVTLSIL